MIRTVVIGFGGMGSQYAEILAGGKIASMTLTGVCCRNEAGQRRIREQYPQAVVYKNVEDTFAHAEDFDAVVIVTPHDTHVEIGKLAFVHKKHVICDKPAGVCTREVRELLAAKPAESEFAMMFNIRTTPAYQKAREFLKSGRLGRVTRAVWVCNTWFRSPAYHKSAPWRSSWDGEHGGLLINQCQHFLDIWQWLFGVPDVVDASIDFGKYNDFTVDDCVDLRFLYHRGHETSPGLRGSFLSASGENPGVNRMEIWGTGGLLTVLDGKRLIFDANDEDTESFCRTNTEIYGQPSHHAEEIPVDGDGPSYAVVFQNFSDHIRLGTPLLAPGEEGLFSLMMANGAYLSAWEGTPVKLPFEDGRYEKLLNEKIEKERETAAPNA